MWILDAGKYAGAIMAILVLAGTIVKWGILKPIKIYIDQATAQIQPTANGGKSLPDVVEGIKKIDKRLDSLENRLKKLEKRSKS